MPFVSRVTPSKPFGYQDFIGTGSYTFTVPARVTKVRAWGIGGGGGGGAAYGDHSAGGGGGAGGYRDFDVSPGDTLSIVVGSAGAGASCAPGGNSGCDGGSTTIDRNGDVATFGGGYGGEGNQLNDRGGAGGTYSNLTSGSNGGGGGGAFSNPGDGSPYAAGGGGNGVAGNGARDGGPGAGLGSGGGGGATDKIYDYGPDGSQPTELLRKGVGHYSGAQNRVGGGGGGIDGTSYANSQANGYPGMVRIEWDMNVIQ